MNFLIRQSRTFMLLLLMTLPAWASEASAREVRPGDVVRWSGTTTVTECRHREDAWAPIDGDCHFPVDLLTEPGRTLSLVRLRNGVRETTTVTVLDYPYPVQRIELEDERRVFLSDEDLARVKRENRQIGALWKRDGERRFQLPLGAPLEPLPPGGRFGSRRIINDAPRNPHSGADYGVPQGTPVHAVADGMVVLADEHFFAGNSLFLDHGDGLISMYFHLDEILVEPGQRVSRDQVVARVGSTGRATGPHLHFGLRWRGARIDPAVLLDPALMPTLPAE